MPSLELNATSGAGSDTQAMAGRVRWTPTAAPGRPAPPARRLDPVPATRVTADPSVPLNRDRFVGWTTGANARHTAHTDARTRSPVESENG